MSLKVETINFNIDKKYKNLIPKYPHYYSIYTIDADYVIANGIRRIICNGLPIKRMWFEREHFKSNDKRLIINFIRDRIQMIPVEQLDEDINLSISVENKTDKPINVMTSDIKGKVVPKMNNMIICELQPKTKLEITNIRYITKTGREDGKHVETSGCVSVENDDGKYDIKFFSNGMIHPKDIIKMANNILIDKFRKVKNILNSIVEYPSNDKHEYSRHELIIEGEDDTVGSMLMKTIIQLFPNILHVKYNLDETTNPPNVIFNIRSKDNNPATIIETACDHLINLLKQ